MNARLKAFGYYLRRNLWGIVGWFVVFTAIRYAVIWTVDRINDGTGSALEVVWTWTMGTAFVVILASLAWVGWKYHLYRRPDKDTGRRANGASQWLFARDALLYIMLALLTAPLTALGIFAMTIPEPIRRTSQEQANLTGWVSIGIAVIIAAFAIANLLIGVVAFRGTKK